MSIFKTDSFLWLCIDENDIKYKKGEPGFYVSGKFISLAFHSNSDMNDRRKENLLKCSRCGKFNQKESDRFLTISLPDQLGLVGFIYCTPCMDSLNFKYELKIIRLLDVVEYN